MPQNKIIDAIDVADAFMRLNATSHLLNAIEVKMHTSTDEEEAFEAICYLFHLYVDERRRLMTNFAEIIDVKI